MDEEWRVIPGTNSGYEVSDRGNVRSLPRKLTRSDGAIVTRKGQTLKQQTTKQGYKTVGVAFNGEPVTSVGIHRLVMWAFVGPQPDGILVCHNNGDPGDNRLANLRYGTPSDNANDMIKHGTNAFRNRTHCPRGHELAGDNVRYDKRKKDHRVCLACNRASAKLSTSHPDFQALSDRKYIEILEHPERHGQTRKTHCVKGHELTPENTRVSKSGNRSCRECKNIGMRELRRRKKADVK